MKLIFSWRAIHGRVAPYCNSPSINIHGINILACLLMDDGGLDIIETISWIDDGITKVEAIIRGEARIGSWDREAWGVKMRPKIVEIFSLYDENYSEQFEIPAFLSALLNWKKFIQSEPDVYTIHEIEI